MIPSQIPDFSLIGFNRRTFLRRVGLISAMSPLALMLLGEGQKAEGKPLPFGPGLDLDLAILNFALNLEYLEAEYYNLGVSGQSLGELGVALTTGNGGSGTLTVKSSPAVPFATGYLKEFMTEIAADEIAHIKFIQSTIIALGGTPVSEPSIDLLNSYNSVAQKAGIASSFDPFANETNFYLGAFSLTDVGVTAYHGAAPLLTTPAVLSGSAGILATESYHDAVLRLTIFKAGADAQEKAQKISDLRDSIDGAADKDQGVTNSDGTANITPVDANSIAFARTPDEVLDIVYGGFKASKGGFFPNGVNGSIM